MSVVVMHDFGRLAGRFMAGPRRLRKHMQSVGSRAARYAKKQYRRTTTHWRKRPDFKHLIRMLGPILTVNVWTDDWLYRMIDVTGAKEHPIVPRGPWLLRFQTGYAAKTVPGKLISRRGGASGEYVQAAAVMHPGFEPRRFSTTIQDKLHKKLGPWMKEEMELFATWWATGQGGWPRKWRV